jgi:hypothetical protein
MAASLINTDFIRQHLTQAVLTVSGLSGVVLIFLPFMYDDVPALGSDTGFWVLAPCVILPFVIFAGYLRWLLTGHLSRWEKGLGYALALIGALGVHVAILSGWSWPPATDDWVGLLFLLAPLAAGAWFITQSLRGRISPAPTALVVMQVVYLVFALFWLTALAIDVPLDYVGSGGYLALVTVLVYTAQAALLVGGQPRKLLRLVPLALVWVLLLLSVGLSVWWERG